MSDKTHQPVLWQHKQCQPRLIDPRCHTHRHSSHTETLHVTSAWSNCTYRQDETLSNCFCSTLETKQGDTPRTYFQLHPGARFHCVVKCKVSLWQTDTSCAGTANDTSFIFPVRFCHLVFETWVHYRGSGVEWHPSKHPVALDWRGLDPDKQTAVYLRWQIEAPSHLQG